jgi:hypothetical protein
LQLPAIVGKEREELPSGVPGILKKKKKRNKGSCMEDGVLW